MTLSGCHIPLWWLFEHIPVWYMQSCSVSLHHQMKISDKEYFRYLSSCCIKRMNPTTNCYVTVVAFLNRKSDEACYRIFFMENPPWHHFILRLSGNFGEFEWQVPKRKDYRILLVHWKIPTQNLFFFLPLDKLSLKTIAIIIIFFFLFFMTPSEKSLLGRLRFQNIIVTRNQIMKYVFGLTTREKGLEK